LAGLGAVVLGLFVAAPCLLSPAAARPALPPPSGDDPLTAQAPDPWRVVGRDGVNSLYLLLALHGHPTPYPDLVQELQPDQGASSFAQLRDAARRHGLETTLYTCRPDELRNVPLPAVVLMEDPTGAGSTFSLLCYSRQQRWYLIDGAAVSTQDLPTDEFRRRWSGVALAPRQQTRAWLPWLCLAIAGLAVYGLLRAWWSGRARRPAGGVPEPTAAMAAPAPRVPDPVGSCPSAAGEGGG
jgi:hypothetical protein